MCAMLISPEIYKLFYNISIRSAYTFLGSNNSVISDNAIVTL